MRHRPGQYLTFALDSAGSGPPQAQLLDLLRARTDRAYRISVKREARPGVPPGLASNWLHDRAGPGTVLKVAPPAGEFFLDERDDGPVVLLSGGVGLTPMMSMLESIVRLGQRPAGLVRARGRERPGARDGRARARAGGPGPERDGAHLLQRAGPGRRGRAATMTSAA